MTDQTWLRGDWMQTNSGRRFYPLDPQPHEIDREDIAHALSLLCRYGGHVDRFYSVAEHCVLMSQAVAPEHALAALLHDATEAYVVDVPRPLKSVLIGYHAIEIAVWVAICARFRIAGDLPAEVKEADNRILLTERAALMRHAERWAIDDVLEPLPVKVEGWSPADAEANWLDRFDELVDARAAGARMTAQRRPPWDVDPRYVDPDQPETLPANWSWSTEDAGWVFNDSVDARDVETREEAGRAGRLFATILAIALIFALAFFVASKLAEGAALRGAVQQGVVPLAMPAYAGPEQLPGAPSLPSGAPEDVAIAGPLWSGTATWYCSSSSTCTHGYGPNDLVGAIDRSLGIAKGELVVVRFRHRSVTVRIVDVCACGGARLIDLTSGAFQRLAPLSYGVLPVTLEVLGGGGPPALVTLPPTDAQP